jgi:hypothetical protein
MTIEKGDALQKMVSFGKAKWTILSAHPHIK